MIISLDTEDTGLDLSHGAMPYLVTTCRNDVPPEEAISFWEWPVNPLTRTPEIPDGDIEQIVELIDAADTIYIHNAPFDARALATIGVDLPWAKVRDTMPASHLLATNRPHNLTWLCVEYLGVDIERCELDVKEVTRQARIIAKQIYPQWALAEEGRPDMPSVKSGSKREEDKPWKNDMWLPRALIRAGTGRYVPENWLTVCSTYANSDSEHTLFLGLELERLIRERGLWKIYQHRLEVQRVACEMVQYGVTAIGEYTEATIQEYEGHVAEIEEGLVEIAAEYGHELKLADGASINDNMRDFFYGAVEQECPICGYSKRIKHWLGQHANGDPCPKCLKSKRRRSAAVPLVTHRRDNLALPVISIPHGGQKKAVAASLDKEAMAEYLGTTDGDAYEFLRLLLDKRAHDTALTYMEAYRRFWVPVAGAPGYYRIHPSLNPCGTDHLRWSSNSPNLQNVAGESKDISNRACFGPLPNREWWRMDFKSIENRIPAYESGQEEMIELFERPGDPPFYGSYYLLNASITCPDLFWPLAEREGAFKHEQPRAYKQVKFGTLAMQYGCGAAKADRLFRMRGAYQLLKDKLPRLTALQQRYLDLAERTGFVETLPDRSVDPERGYPILASRTEDGRVLSTTPFNYHTSGTACWVKNVALVRCAAQCAEWRAEGFDAHVALEVHDEILFDFPMGADMEENLPRAAVLKGLMEQAGENLVPRVPTPVSVEWHTDSWANGVRVDFNAETSKPRQSAGACVASR